MKTIILCTVGLIALVFTSLAQGQSNVLMKALDVNGDGELSVKEVANAVTVLKLLDDNGDGVLSKKELGFDRRFGDMENFDDWDGFAGMDDLDDMDWPGRNKKGRGKAKANPGRLLNPAQVKFKDGTDTIPDRETYKKLAAPGEKIMGQPGIHYLKFQIEEPDTNHPKLYFMNTNTHPAHTMFMAAIGKSRGPWGMRGALVYHPFVMAPSGQPGLYTFAFEMQDAFSFEMVQVAYQLLSKKSPILKDHLAYDPMARGLNRYKKEKAKYDAAKLPVFLSQNKYANIAYLPLNQATSFGRLRLMQSEERPGPRDIVIYPTLPNEMPRVAGVITSVRQTPLSHVNLRAIQDKIPNAFVSGADHNKQIAALVGKYVCYIVALDGYQLREATLAEVNAHFAAARPKKPRSPKRDLTVTKIRSLDQIGFTDSSSVGAKAANLATLRTFELSDGVVPNGFAVPFYFYDAFMKHNGFYKAGVAMRADPAFQQDTDKRQAALKEFRAKIKQGDVPAWMTKAIGKLQQSFPTGSSIRCRSSTNNEDLPGFSGAGLYDSYTHHPGEGDLSKSIKQVYASLWNFRAYEEREFFRIDHFTTAMGVLVHLNYKNEQANGVAVTEDIVYQTAKQNGRSYYLNVQIGEDMITNPEGESIPEEILLSPRFVVDDVVVRRSNRIADGKRVLNTEQLNQLRLNLKTIHRQFAKLYGQKPDSRFAIEIEFKVTAQGKLVIKQARPWVY